MINVKIKIRETLVVNKKDYEILCWIRHSLAKSIIVLVKPSWACSWTFHEHLCSWKLHEHAHEALTRTCAWRCHGHDHFRTICIQAPKMNSATLRLLSLVSKIKIECPDAYYPKVVMRVTPSCVHVLEGFMSMLMKLSWAQMPMRTPWACYGAFTSTMIDLNMHHLTNQI